MRPGCAVSALLVSHVACLLLTWRDWLIRSVFSADGADMGAGSRQRRRRRRHEPWCEPTPLDCVSPPGVSHAVFDIFHGLCAAQTTMSGKQGLCAAQTTMSGKQSLWCVHARCGLHCFAAHSDYPPYLTSYIEQDVRCLVIACDAKAHVLACCGASLCNCMHSMQIPS